MTMHGAFVERADACLAAIIADPRWDVEDELLFQVAAFTWYGYCFGIGRTLYFLDADAIDAHVIACLTGLGAGDKYVRGLVARACEDFGDEPPDANDVYTQLIGIGHSHFSERKHDGLVASIYDNYALLSEGAS